MEAKLEERRRQRDEAGAASQAFAHRGNHLRNGKGLQVRDNERAAQR
jgi:hypothetical protein